MITVDTKSDKIQVTAVLGEPQLLFLSYKSGFIPQTRTAILKKGLSVFSIESTLPNNVQYKVFPLSKKETPSEPAKEISKTLYDIQDTLQLITQLSWLSEFARSEGKYEGGDDRDFKRAEEYKEVMDDLFGITLDHLEEERQEMLERLDSLSKGMVLSKKITESGGKYFVYDHTGKKKLGGPYDTKGEAVTRLKQVEGHKNDK